MSEGMPLREGDYWFDRTHQIRALLDAGEDISNMRMNRLTIDLDNGNPRGNTAQQWKNRTVKAHGQVVDRIPMQLHKYMVDSHVGSVPRFDLEPPGGMCSYASIEYAYMFSIFADIPHPQHVLEIGAGYGGLMRVMMEAWPNALFSIIDYEPQQEIQKYFLTESGAEVDRVEWFPTGTVVKNFDVVVSTRSFMEMPIAAVQWYFKLIDEELVPGGYFYTVQRVKKVNRWTDYPFRPHWHRVYSGNWPLHHEMKEALFRNDRPKK